MITILWNIISFSRIFPFQHSTLSKNARYESKLLLGNYFMKLKNQLILASIYLRTVAGCVVQTIISYQTIYKQQRLISK